ncbi:MAG: beta-lactamase family protein [Burkholderiaceae bacterium]|nr:beta-lactamase family protein [Burkholderiaceae bacterium]
MSTEIDRVIEFQRAAGHYPGIVMHVEREGAVLLERCVGAMGPGSDAEPMRDDAFFRIASLTKGIVSTVAMMFVESGDIVLDAPVAEYLPVLDGLRMADGSRPLRPPSVRDLMRHTSGLAYAGETRDPAARARADAIGLDARLFSLGADEVLETLCRLPLCAQPGTTFRYGFSTDVLGLVIEAVSSRRLGEVIGDRLLEPLGMHETGFDIGADQPGRFARAHPGDLAWSAFCSRIDDGITAGNPLHSGGGGLISTLPDFVRFARFVADGGFVGQEALLRPETFAELTRDQLGADIDGPFAFTGPGFGFSLGWAVCETWGAPAYPAAVGELTWSGVSGTFLYFHPARRWFAVGFTSNTATRLMTRFELRRAIASLDR